MKSKRWMWIAAGVVLAGGGTGWWRMTQTKKSGPTYQEAIVQRDAIRIEIQSTGVVQPQNRVEIIPIVAGRIEQILVEEGDTIRKGQILAWTSSSERAALLDAAAAKGPAEVKKWEEIYKPLPLVAPIDGSIIARNMEPGQRLVSTSPVFVMSDRLIVVAQVDETDIGRVHLGQAATIALDAFPRQPVPARVDKIAHEAKTVSNVTIYEVDVRPDHLPAFFRSGMTGTVTIVIDEHAGALVVPVAAVTERDGVKGVWITPRTTSKSDHGPGVPGAQGTSRQKRGSRHPRGGRTAEENRRGEETARASASTSREEGRPSRGSGEEGRGREAKAGLPPGVFQPVTLGLTDNKRVEVLSGLTEGQVVWVPDLGMPWMNQAESASSPFGWGGPRRPAAGRR